MSKYVVTDSGQTDATIDELQKRAKKYLRYDRICNAFLPILGGIILGSVVLVTYLERLGVLFPVNWSGVIVMFDFLVAVSIWIVALRKTSEYYLNTDEWAKFYADSIATNVSRYLGTESSGMKKGYKKASLKYAKGFLSCIEEKWTVGNLKSAKDFVGTAVADLKKNLRYRVIPAIKSEDGELLRKISQDMEQFVIFSNNLSIDKIEWVNTWMSKLPDHEPAGKTRFSRMLIFVKTRQMVKHSIVMLVVGAFSFLLAYLGSIYEIPIEYCWMGGITLFVGVAAIYFSRQPKGEK